MERPSPAHGAKKRVVLGVQGPAGGYHASATRRDAPTKPLGQTITVVPRYCPISGPSICCSSCLKSPSHLFLPGLRVSSWVGALSLLVSLPRNRSPALPGALLPVRCRSAPAAAHALVTGPPPHPDQLWVRTWETGKRNLSVTAAIIISLRGSPSGGGRWRALRECQVPGTPYPPITKLRGLSPHLQPGPCPHCRGAQPRTASRKPQPPDSLLQCPMMPP